jgi:methionyl-tRNA formyltransferase
MRSVESQADRPVRIVLLCATRRGLRFLNELVILARSERICVFSFREDGDEPRYFHDIRSAALTFGADFVEARDAYGAGGAAFWRHGTIDLLMAVNWRYLLPRAAFSVPVNGSFVFHDSLLPKNRGFSPTVWAMANGEDHTGVTLFEMNDAVDSGDIVDQVRVPIGEHETIRDAVENTTQAYIEMLRRNFESLRAGTAPRHPQDHASATYCRRRTPADDVISWKRSRKEIHNLIRAVTDPYPGAQTTLDGRRLIVWAAQPIADSSHGEDPPGTITGIRQGVGIEVVTGSGKLLVTSVQIGGSGPIRADQLLTRPGAILGR